MPDWGRRLRERFAAAGRACDADVLDELAIHAATEYDAVRTRGHDDVAATRHVDTLVDQWVAHAADLTRPESRPPAVEPPSTGASVWPGLRQDLRYALRLLARAPGFALTAIVTIALGIGATTLLFGVVDGVLLKPLPWAQPDRLVRVTETRDGRAGRVAGTISNGTFHAWRDGRTAIDDVGGWMTQTATLAGTGEPTRVALNPTTANLFALLGAPPHLGRLFADSDGRPGARGAALLSYGLWQERFGGRPDVVGQAIQLDGQPYDVVGVMPQAFAFPDRVSRLWTAWQVPPVVHESGALAGVIFRAVARLADGATPAQAAAEATARARTAPDLGTAARALFGAVGPIEVVATPEIDALTADVRPAVLLLLAASGLLLLTATANVASLQLARAVARRREVAVRASIGAGQGRIARQLLIENGLIGLAGGVGGLVLAAVLHRWLPALVPEGFPRLEGIAVDPRAALFALGVSLAVSVACGLLPAWQARRVNLVESLAEGGVAPVGGATRSPLARARGLIMVSQVAIACVLLVAASLLTRSWLALIAADRGYDPAHVLTARLPLPRDYPAERRVPLLDDIVARVSALPGVAHAAYSPSLPLLSSGGFVAFTMRRPDAPDVEVGVQATQRIVSPGYFAAMGLRLVGGRLLSDADTARTPPAIVVNRTFARQYLGAQAVGARIPPGGPRAGLLAFTDPKADWQVVGVVDDMRQDTLGGEAQPEIFASFQQLTPGAMRIDPILVLRTTADPAALVPNLRAAVRAAAPWLAVDSVMTMEDRVAESLARPRLYAVVLTWFGGFAVLIAAVGLFGVLSFSVAQRTREIGVRSALGAQLRDIVGLVVRQALWIVGAGLTLGLAMALGAVQWLTAVLHGLSPYDTVTFVVVPLAIGATAIVACVGPARRAARVDPLSALRRG